MQFHELQNQSSKNRKRVGRGIAAGQGKTAGRGTKGQNSRSGGKVRPGFEGGQNPLTQRLPKKKGFLSRKVPATVVYTADLSEVKGKTVTNQTLLDAGLIDDVFHPVKVIVKGELKSAVTVEVAAASKTAISAIEKAGGSFKATAPAMRQKKKA